MGGRKREGHYFCSTITKLGSGFWSPSNRFASPHLIDFNKFNRLFSHQVVHAAQVLEPHLVVVLQSRVDPELPQQELHLIFLGKFHISYFHFICLRVHNQ